MGISNEYWTKVPQDPDPTAYHVRDGVAIEDDMALRALLPHIRPKRGRKRPEDSETPVSAQRPRLSPPSALDDQRTAPWPVLGDPHLSVQSEVPRSAHPGQGPNDGSQTPFSRWPSSAITPTTGNAFWGDASEPQSAITPTQSKAGRQRRGAKNVSSAWKPGGLDSGGKTRGRPPRNRTPIDGPGLSFQPYDPMQTTATQTTSATLATDNTGTQHSQSTDQGFAQPSLSGQPPTLDRTTSAPVPGALQRNRSSSGSQRPGRPSISLQVPDRPGGNVRLATPPPAVVINGQEGNQGPMGQPSARAAGAASASRWREYANQTAAHYEYAHRGPQEGLVDTTDTEKIGDYYFERVEDRTNVDMLLGFFINTMHSGAWFDLEGNPAEPPSVDESTAVINAFLDDMLRTATSPQAFLINLGALAGAKMLMSTQPKNYRTEDGPNCYNYKFTWEYRFAHLRGSFNMTQSVPMSMWKKRASPEAQDEQTASSLSSREWQNKYDRLLGQMKKRENDLTKVKGKVIKSLKQDFE